MPRPKPDRDALLEGLADHVLAHGLAGASLRPLAASVGTSDRMLIYHFGSKDALIAAILERLARRMATGLDAALPAQVMPCEADLIAAVITMTRAPEVRPFMGLWFDILSMSRHAEGIPDGVGLAILSIFRDWITRRHPNGLAGSERTLALIEGLLVIDAAGASGMVDRVVAALPR